jgi:hypothetical protein
MGILSRKKAEPIKVVPIDFPSGVCVRTDKGHFYISGKYRHRLGSQRVFESWAFPRVIKTTESALANFRQAKTLGFRDGTLIRQTSTGHLYFISQRKRRLVTNPDTLTVMGLKPEDGTWVADFEVELHEEGENLE